MKRLFVIAGLLVAGLGLVAVAHAKGSGTITVRPAKQLEWKQVRPGVRASVLWGDMEHTAWGGLNRTDPGSAEAWHSHSTALRVVVISGMVSVEGGDEPTSAVGPGSFVEVPANVRHRALCVSKDECILLVTQSARYDRIPDGSASGRPGMDAADEEAARFSREVWEAP